MNFNKLLLGVVILFSVSSCQSKFGGAPEKYHAKLETSINSAGSNGEELLKALEEAPEEQKEGVAFLITNMPSYDLTTLKADFILENVEYAYMVREKYSWCREVPKQIFLNDVLPYASLNERRDNWRADFYNRFSKYVEGATSMEAAIDSVNRHIKSEVNVEYNTKREKPDQSPYESMEQNMASCSGLSILLTDAFRAVGIPSRVAGTVNWWDNRGNHNWCEVFVEGRWYFTEFYPSGLDKGWFLNDAGRADKSDPEHAIWASSWAPTDNGEHFPMVWDLDCKEVPGLNVTDRYIDVYTKAMESAPLKEGEVIVNILLVKEEQCSLDSDNRFQTEIYVLSGDKVIASGVSPGENDDLNKFLKVKLKKSQEYSFKFKGPNGEEIIRTDSTDSTDGQSITLSLK